MLLILCSLTFYVVAQQAGSGIPDATTTGSSNVGAASTLGTWQEEGESREGQRR